MFNVDDYIHIVDDAFRLFSENQLVNPPKSQSVSEDDQTFRLKMPASWPGRCSTTKVIEERSNVGAGRLGTRTAYIEFCDLRQRRMLRFDAGAITDMRTGAAASVGLRYIVESNIRRVGIVGTGRVGRSIAKTVDRVFDLDEIWIFSRTREHVSAFVDDIQPLSRARIRPAAGLRDCIHHADALLTAVPTATPIIDAPDVAEISALVVIAGDPRTKQVTQRVLQEFEIVVDHLEQARESGEFIEAEENGVLDDIRLARLNSGDAATISDLCCVNPIPDRGARRALYLTGLAVLDLMFCLAIYQRLEGGGSCG